MRFIFIILIASFVITSCLSGKTGSKGDKGKGRSYSPKKMKMPKPAQDSTIFEYKESDEILLGSSPPDEKIVTESPKPMKGGGKGKIKKDEATLTVTDKTDKDKGTNKDIEGIIAYNVPDEMTVGKRYSIKVRISKNVDDVEYIITGDDDHIADTTISSTVTIESVRVAPVMSADLLSVDNAFNITPLSSKEQNIDSLGYTEWEWSVLPKQSGNHILKLIVKVRIISDGDGFYKDITVFQKEIDTKSNIGYSLKEWTGSHWQWFLSTIIIPVIIWWRKRKEKKKPEDSDKD